MRNFNQIRRAGFISAWWFFLLIFVGATFATAEDSADAVELRVRQIYFEGYPVTASGRLESTAVERLGEMLRDPTEEPYWSNIVLALGASENSDAYRHLADFAVRTPSGEVSSAVYQARVSLPVALGQLAYSHPTAFGLIEAMARDARLERGWRFQSLAGASLAGALRRSAITGLAVSGRPEAATVLSDLEDRTATRAGATSGEAADQSDELLRHLEFARTLHERVAADGPASVLGRRPVIRPTRPTRPAQGRIAP